MKFNSPEKKNHSKFFVGSSRKYRNKHGEQITRHCSVIKEKVDVSSSTQLFQTIPTIGTYHVFLGTSILFVHIPTYQNLKEIFYIRGSLVALGNIVWLAMFYTQEVQIFCLSCGYLDLAHSI